MLTTLAHRRCSAPLFIAFCLLAAVLGGCIHIDQTLTLHSDGTGTIDLVYAMPEDQPGDIQAAARAVIEQSAPNGNPVPMPFDQSDADVRGEFKTYERHGVFLQSVRTESRNGWKYRTMAIRFQSLQGLARTGILADRTLSLTRDERGNYVLVQAAGKKSGDYLAMVEQIQSDPILSELLTGFRAAIRVQTPGRILESNATQKSERMAAWLYDSDRDPHAIENVQRATMRIVFDGRGLKIPVLKQAASKQGG